MLLAREHFGLPPGPLLTPSWLGGVVLLLPTRMPLTPLQGWRPGGRCVRVESRFLPWFPPTHRRGGGRFCKGPAEMKVLASYYSAFCDTAQCRGLRASLEPGKCGNLSFPISLCWEGRATVWFCVCVVCMRERLRERVRMFGYRQQL